MYRANLINPLDQFEQISFDLILEDINKELPELRFSKSFTFSITKSEISQDILDVISCVYFGRFITGLDTELKSQDSIDIEINLPEGMELPD